MEEYWTLERVIQWLEINNFRSAIEIFKGTEYKFLSLIFSFSLPPYILTCV